MKVIAYDPYVSGARAGQLGVRLVGLDELMAESDFLSIHLPRTPETVGLIGEPQLRQAKPTLRIVNAARGGIIDEDALYKALADGRIAGAGLDVFATEPCTDSPLFGLGNVVVTPHLGASTDEAQERAGIAVAQSVRLALAGELVPDAVNVSGGVIDPEVRPGIPLTESLGRLFTALAGGLPAHLDIEIRGEITASDVSVLRLAALKGLFTDVVENQVSYVNAPVLATERGIEVRLVTQPDSPQYRNVVTLRGTLADGRTLSVSGTLTGPRQIHKLVGGRRLRARGAARRAPAGAALHRPAGRHRRRRPAARRRRREHRRDAGRPQGRGRRRGVRAHPRRHGPDRPHRRDHLGDRRGVRPGRDARRGALTRRADLARGPGVVAR